MLYLSYYQSPINESENRKCWMRYEGELNTFLNTINK
ncbi:hypothetical protein BN000_05128 [Neobacillus massiliamazoniensis]|uniref:Uncharacterized protein n=1 Tax=Neobacillus massiliamazoniensis TaxID=1499688 RepID=A0A0U1P428_9BACI|nr:hypothetical protein BN000_05128 [Neobacillus massiliamazoniensis]